MINHDIVRLHISVHDTLAVAEIKCFEQLINVEAHVIIRKAGVQCPEIGVVDGFKDQTRSLALVIAHYIQQRDDVGASSEVLKNLDLSLNLLLLDRLENLDDTFLIVDDIDALEYLGVFSSA